jgi:hypothetical protein
VDAAQTSDAFDYEDAEGIILASSAWETTPLLLKTAARLQKKIAANYPGTENNTSADNYNARALAALAIMRGRHNDMAALDEFATWLEGSKPDVLEDSALDALEPLWRFPQYAGMRSAANLTLGNTNSPWGTLAWLLDTSQGFLWMHKPLASPALIIPEFRALVLRELTNRVTGGDAVIKGGRNVVFTYSSGAAIQTYAESNDLAGLQVGAKVVFRRCDLAAEQLSAIPGFPAMNLLWSEAKKDEAVTGAITLLSTSADRIEAVEKSPWWSPAFDPPLVRLKEKAP